MLGAAGVQHHLQLRGLRRQRGEGALVLDFLDVGPGAADHGGGTRQFARHIAAGHADARQPAGAHHAALDDRRQHHRIDVAAAQHDADLAAGEARLVADQRRQPNRARTLHHRLFDLQQHHDRLLDVAFRHQHDVVDLLTHDLPRQQAGLAYRDALGQRSRRAGHLGALEQRVHGRKVLGLHTDDLDAGPQSARGGGDAGNQPAAADGDAQAVDIGMRSEHLQRDRALPGDHRGIVVRMHHRQAALGRHPGGLGLGVIEAVAAQDDLGAEAARALDLHRGREARHHDYRRHAHPLRVVRHALRVIAGRYRDHTAPALVFGQRQQPVQRTALLEAGGELEVLELEVHLGAGNLRQRA